MKKPIAANRAAESRVETIRANPKEPAHYYWQQVEQAAHLDRVCLLARDTLYTVAQNATLTKRSFDTRRFTLCCSNEHEHI